MNNEMKLEIAKLRADGYDVEIITNHNTDKYNDYIKRIGSWADIIAAFGIYPPPPEHPSSFFTTDYKVTKKKKQVCFDIDSPEWMCIVDYIINSRYEIEGKENDFGTLQPMLDFFNRNCNFASKSK